MSNLWDKVYSGKRPKPVESREEFEAKRAALSHRAQVLLERVEQGHWYKAGDSRCPAAMEELWDAGLVTDAGRVEVISSAFVPTVGFTPMQQEQFERRGDW